MNRLISDFFRYIPNVQHPIRTKSNKREQLMQFVLKDYPAYLWKKPSFWRVIIFPFLLGKVVFYGYDADKNNR